MEAKTPMEHFINLADLAPQTIHNLLQTARELKAEWRQGGNEPVLQGKSLALVFMKPSLRTRVSFEMAMVHLGGYAFYLAPDEIKLGSRESVGDVARVPIINGLSDYNHPAQALADLFTILEKKDKLEGVKLAFVGDGNNVARSLLFGAMKTGMHFAIASPAGYTLSEADLELAKSMRVNEKQRIKAVQDPEVAVRDADVIYTDVWTSMGQESETAQRLRVFPPYQVNEALVRQAADDAIVMHCLPAHRGEEITDAVADGPQSVLFLQAENRMHAQKAILYELLAGR
jgi:ornithine carbamoyltransferase